MTAGSVVRRFYARATFVLCKALAKLGKLGIPGHLRHRSVDQASIIIGEWSFISRLNHLFPTINHWPHTLQSSDGGHTRCALVHEKCSPGMAL
ncbi:MULTISPECIES: hypothetical protein [Pseudovibrio]|uniref:hypothetical protein n=1 Tax=Stappiaceae TaxID=2821832 RepID=UPI0023658CF5|nr:MULTISPECIES: hypothetical protein [Pseudovibrio]MDD7911129.1 hypothetical protein [Pseudovibrio exalbescens]MDX5593183.1 hypothetical protein [Pseudovibrio sp. SPO723]